MPGIGQTISCGRSMDKVGGERNTRMLTGSMFRCWLWFLVFGIFSSTSILISTPSERVQQGDTERIRDWPQFRGRNVDGIVGERVFDRDSPVILKINWKVKLGSGYSGVSIQNGLAVTMFDDGKFNVVAGFDSTTGRELWRFPVSPKYRGHDGSLDGPISTPLIYNNLTIALGPSGRLLALNNLDGTLVWSTDLVKEHGAVLPHYGFASSPIVENGTVVLQIGSKEGAIAGFDPATGKRRWIVGNDFVDYQNAVPIARNGNRYVLASGYDAIMGINPSSGDVLWRYNHGGGGSRGVWCMVPVLAGPDRVFLAFKNDSSALIELDGLGMDVKVRRVWEERTIRNSYNVAVYHEGYLYAYSSRFLTCVNADTGKAMWKSRSPGDGFLIFVDGHLVIQTKEGSLHVAEASPAGYNEVARLDLFSDLTWTPPSFANGSIFVRSLGEMARIDILSGTEIQHSEADTREDLVDSGFEAFLKEVKTATNKKDVVDRFMAAQLEFPVVEEERFVHFLYRGDAEDMAIGGDMIGARQEAPMTRIEGTDLFYYSTELQPDARVSYMFFLDFQNETLDPLNPRTTRSTIWGSDMEHQVRGTEKQLSWLAMPRWKHPAHLNPPPVGVPRGRVENHDLRSDIFGITHSIDVYLPAGYDTSVDRFPTIYLHSGSDALARGEWMNSLDNLIGKTVEPLIVVFIEIDAGDDFIPRDDYGEVWAKEIIPFIDRTYRTNPTMDMRANAGSGRGAHEAIYCAFKYPNLSSRIAIQSLFMVEFGRARFEPLVRTADEHPITIYMEWGSYDLRGPQEGWDMREYSQDLADWLRGRGYDVVSREVPDGTGWPSWKNRNDVVLKSLFPIVSKTVIK